MISVTLHFENHQQMVAALTAVYPDTDFGQKAEAEAPKPLTAPADPKPAVAPSGAIAVAGSTATTTDTKSTTEVSYDQVKAAILKVVTGKGNGAATAVLAQFGVTKGPALKAEQYAAVIAACEAA